MFYVVSPQFKASVVTLLALLIKFLIIIFQSSYTSVYVAKGSLLFYFSKESLCTRVEYFCKHACLISFVGYKTKFVNQKIVSNFSPWRLCYEDVGNDKRLVPLPDVAFCPVVVPNGNLFTHQPL